MSVLANSITNTGTKNEAFQSTLRYLPLIPQCRVTFEIKFVVTTGLRDTAQCCPQSPSAHTIWVAAVALKTCSVARTYLVFQSSVGSPSNPNTILKTVSGKRPVNVKLYSLRKTHCNFHFMQGLQPVPLGGRNLLLFPSLLHSSCTSQHFSKTLFICLIP